MDDNNDNNDNNSNNSNNTEIVELYKNDNATKKPGTFKLMALLVMTSVFTSFVVGGSLYYKFSSDLKEQNDLLKNINPGTTSTKSSGKTTKTSYSGSSQVAQVAKNVGPSIVGVKITTKVSQSNNFNDFFGGFGDSGNSENDSSQAQASEGSGIIISQNGYIMTNYHVVSSADPKNSASKQTTLEVYLQNKKSVKATFVGGDQDSDLAVIKVDLNNLPTAKLGDSSKINVGDPVIAIGNPLGLEFAGSVTTGVVSALNRSVESGNVSQNLIQTDAAINAGNSGGALLNNSGEVIGINSIKISQTGVEGIGFAIPTNEAKPIIDQLIKYQKVKGKPMIGIAGQEISQDVAKAYNMHIGIYVTSVNKNSAAAVAGIQKGDIITELGGKSVKTMSEINTIKRKYKSGDSAKIKIVRNNKEKTLTIKFKEAD